ncbi:MAG: hypothetical protein UH678_01765 [Fibrobacteraceae bacterium]|nr:hypothetical protein [Fibrobacteraceae bacterium]
MMEEKKSVAEEISENLKAHGLMPIPVQTLNEEAEASRYFAGTFDEFIDAAKILGAKGIFVEALYLEEDEFYYNSGIEEDDCCDCCDCCDCDCECDDDCCCKDKSEEDCCCKNSEEKCCCEDSKEDCECSCDDELFPEDLDGLDLSLFRPEIAKYEQYIGECCGVRLVVPGPDHLEVEIFAEWFDEFATLVDEASAEIEEDPAKVLEVIEKNCAE